jgi:hypothetical protein
VGPRAFGYDIDYRPVQELAAARRRRLTRSARLTHPGARH